MARAKRQTTKPAAAAQAKPIPMIKLAGGGERPETAGDRQMLRRIQKAESRKPDGAKAHCIASSMEEDLREIECLMESLRLMAEGANASDKHTSLALYGIVHGLEGHIETAKEKREKIMPLIWGYRFGAEPEAPAATVADFDKAIANLKAARARAKQAALVGKAAV